MSGLFGGGQTIRNSTDVVAGIQVQTSGYGGVLPLAYGTGRCRAAVIDYDDFKAIPHTTSQQTGKGGGGTTVTSTTYTYTAMVILALCEGPVSAVNMVWRDKDVGGMTGFGFTLLTGTRPQTAWSYLTTKHPAKAAGYSGFALACGSAVDLGSSGSLKNHSFEVKALLATELDPADVSAFACDAKPDAVIPDFLSNAYYGAGWNAAQIDNLSSGAASYGTYCQASGFVISPIFDDQKAAKDHLQSILDATNSAAVWSAGASGGMVLKVVPFGDVAITANGATYTPNTAPLYDLTYDDFLGVVDADGKPTGEDAIRIERTNPQDVFNCVPVKFNDRLNQYNASVVKDPDMADVALNGYKEAQPLVMPMITRQAHALQISRIAAQRNVWVRNKYTFRLGWRYLLLEPMDLVTITDPKQGINKKVVRIKSIDLPDEEGEEQGLTVVAEEWPFGAGAATIYTTQSNNGSAPNTSVAPGNVTTPVFIDSPALYSQNGGNPEVLIATSGGQYWGGADVYISYDNATYAYAGTITKAARYGTISAGLNAATTKNWLLYSEQFDNGNWSKETGVTVTPNTDLNPSSAATTADTIATSVAGNGVYQNSSLAAANGTKVTLSVWMKAASAVSVTMMLQRLIGADAESTVVSVGTSWQRYTFTHSATWTGTSTIQALLRCTTAASVQMWGAQLEVGDMATTYQLNTNLATTGPSSGDSQNTCAVDLTLSGGTLSSISSQGAADVLDLCAITDGSSTEFLSYTNATLTATSKYNLTGLWRGAYGTANATHASGKSFVRLDDAVFRYPVPSNRVGQTLYVKFASFNLWGQAKQDISTLTAYTYAPGSQGGTNYPTPSGVTVATSRVRPS